MARYCASFSGKVGSNTANTPIVNLSGGTGERLIVRELYLVSTAAITAAPALVIGRSTARGTVTTSATTISQDPSAGASVGTLDIAWSVNPTFTTTAANRIRNDFPSTAIGQQTTWYFHSYGVWVPATAGAGLIVWNVNASGNPNNGAWDGHVVWDED